MAGNLKANTLVAGGLVLTFLDPALSVVGFSLGLPTIVTGIGAILLVVGGIMRFMNKN